MPIKNSKIKIRIFTALGETICKRILPKWPNSNTFFLCINWIDMILKYSFTSKIFFQSHCSKEIIAQIMLHVCKTKNYYWRGGMTTSTPVFRSFSKHSRYSCWNISIFPLNIRQDFTLMKLDGRALKFYISSCDQKHT